MSAASPSIPLRGARVSAVATREEIVDAAFLVSSVALGLYGFRATYGDLGFLAGAAVGLAVGVAIAHVALRLALPWLAAVSTSVVAFFALGGGVVLRSTALGGVVPTRETLSTLVGTSIHGWRELLTLLPPIGSSGPLLVIPYLLGMAAGVFGYLLARRTRSSLLPALVPAGVLAAAILFGTPQPASLLLQGTVFAAVILAWASVRHARRSIVTAGGTRSLWRRAEAVAMLVLAAAGAKTVAAHLPFAHSRDRVVLRNYVQPPFDPSAYPSPLSGFHKYVTPAKPGGTGLRNTALFTVKGLPAGARIRLATMDVWDGIAWGVTGASGSFARVGPRIPQPAAGKTATVRITVDGYDDVWVPDAGSTEAIDFLGAGSRPAALRDAFRYDLTTGTAVEPLYLQKGDSYSLDAVIPRAPSAAQLNGAVRVGSAEFSSLPGEAVAAQSLRLASVAKKLTAGVKNASDYATLQAVAAALKRGAYSDAPKVSLPGNGLSRMKDFFGKSQLVGNDEQYAAGFALVAEQLGYSARVVLGAVPEADGVVKGTDIHAWPEVEFSGAVGWVPFDVTPPKTQHPSPNPPQVLYQNRQPNRVPPAVPAPPPANESSVDTSAASSKSTKKKSAHHGPSIVFVVAVRVARTAGPPIGTILAIMGAIVLAKLLRRRRRRRRGSPADRVSAGWRELVDLAVDLGADRPGRDTRRRVARSLGQAEITAMAHAADAVTFGPHDPDNQAASGYWAAVEETRARILGRLSRRRRLAASLSLASLHGPRLRRRRPSPEPEPAGATA